jgi:hypothetical protein
MAKKNKNAQNPKNAHNLFGMCENSEKTHVALIEK